MSVERYSNLESEFWLAFCLHLKTYKHLEIYV